MNIYIGNLPLDFDDDELVELFEEYGKVKKAQIIRDRYTKVSRGFGFVEMDNKDAAQAAIKDWNNGSIDDQIIHVKESKPKKRDKKHK
ncbi:RNA-binding protein [candidate division KSB1 bacterium]|nr:RNA-binding protein [candidate division KSB1 bacterium]